MNRNRGILIRWSKKDENHLALLQLAAGLIAYKKANAARLAPAQSRYALSLTSQAPTIPAPTPSPG